MVCATNERKIQNFQVNGLPSKTNFDNVSAENTKPESVNSGLNNIDSMGESDKMIFDNLILSEAPNFYKERGTSVSKIPYLFETPVPKYFREKGLFKNEKTWKFVTWSFSKCYNQSRVTEYDNCDITLQPYEFICGRNKSSEECFLTPKEFRGQLDSLLKRGLIQKGANSKANRYSSYIWVTERFYETKGQPKGQPTGQVRANSGPQSRRLDDIEDIEDHHPNPSSFSNDLIDDPFSKKEQKEKEHVFTGKYYDGSLCEVYLTRAELDECLKSKGTIERVREAIDQLAMWPGRKYKIKEWSTSIIKWNFKNKHADKIQENEKTGKTIEDLYSDRNGWNGWTARVYRDPQKDQRGVLFEGKGAQMIPILISFSESNFKEKCLEIIKTKKMKKIGEK